MDTERIEKLEQALAIQLELNASLAEQIENTREFVRLGFEVLTAQAGIPGIDWPDLDRQPNEETEGIA